MRLFPTLLAACCLAACGAADRSGGATVRDSAGIRIVENPAPEDRVAFTLAAEPEVSIGSVDGPPEYSFQRVRDAARLEDGRIVVADGAEVRFYDPAGRHLRTTGGKGEGPGEFSFLGTIEPCGDVVLAGDVRQQRITVYDRDGELLRTEPIPASGNRVFALTLEGCDPEGRPILRSPQAGSLAHQEGGGVPLLRMEPGTGQADTIARVPTRAAREGVSTPFEPATRWAFGPAWFHVLDTDTIQVRTYGLDGTLRQVARVPHEPRAVSAEDHRRAIDEVTGRMHPTFAGPMRSQMEQAPVPPRMPAVRTMAADAEGRVWIQPFTAPWEEPATGWLVLDADGELLGTVRLPAGFRPLHIGDDWVLGVAPDELDVPYVRLYRFQEG